MRQVTDSHEMFQSLPWPFDGEKFPASLGAVVQRSVLDGTLPALIVGHTSDGGWYVGDGLNDPNLPGEVVATHIGHVIERNSAVERLATLPPGYEARRGSPGEAWRIERVDLEA
jgi:hypothetical protein